MQLLVFIYPQAVELYVFIQYLPIAVQSMIYPYHKNDMHVHVDKDAW